MASDKYIGVLERQYAFDQLVLVLHHLATIRQHHPRIPHPSTKYNHRMSVVIVVRRNRTIQILYCTCPMSVYHDQCPKLSTRNNCYQPRALVQYMDPPTTVHAPPLSLFEIVVLEKQVIPRPGFARKHKAEPLQGALPHCACSHRMLLH